MPAPADMKLEYEFEHSTSPEALELRAEARIEAGWKPSGNPKSFDLRWPSGQRETHYWQAFTRVVSDSDVDTCFSRTFEIVKAPATQREA